MKLNVSSTFDTQSGCGYDREKSKCKKNSTPKKYHSSSVVDTSPLDEGRFMTDDVMTYGVERYIYFSSA